MSTRRDITEINNSVPMGFEGSDTPGDIVVPSCTIEDVDRSVFNLFDKQLPLQSKTNSAGIKRIPVIFATGERFAVLRRKQPLRDKSGALILPLISIMRKGINQEPTLKMGPGQTSPIVIKRRLTKDNPIYKRLINERNLRNSDSAASSVHNLSPVGSGASPGTMGTRRIPDPVTQETRRGHLLTPSFDNNIYETLTIPPTKYYTATYDVTFWSQYTQEMNSMIMAMMSLYQNNHRRTFRLETEKGYWFVGYVSSDFTSGDNSDDFTNDERLIRYSFEIQVNGYVIAPEYPGSPAYVRRYISAPTIDFAGCTMPGRVLIKNYSPQRVDPDAFVLEDLYSDTNDLVDSGVALRGAHGTVDALDQYSDRRSTSVGGHASRRYNPSVSTIVVEKDVFTGEEKTNVLSVKTVNTNRGETVFREQLIRKMEDIT